MAWFKDILSANCKYSIQKPDKDHENCWDSCIFYNLIRMPEILVLVYLDLSLEVQGDSKGHIS